MKQKTGALNFGKIDTFAFLGGGDLLRLVLHSQLNGGEKIHVFTSPRQAEEIGSDGTTFENFLTVHSLPFSIIKTLQDPALTSFVTPEVLGISVSAGWIFKQDTIDVFGGKLVNIHGSPLPLFGGGGGMSWPILQGERRGGATIHLVDTGIDTGDILLASNWTHSPKCRTPNDYLRYSLPRGAALMKTFLTNVRKEKTFTPRVQDSSKSTYWPRLSTDIHGYIDWRWGTRSLERFVNAFDEPYAGAATFVGETKIRLKNCRIRPSREQFHPFQWGLVYRVHNGVLSIAANGGTLEAHTALPEKSLTIKPGDRMHTPLSHLEEARGTTAIYTARGLKRG